MGISIYRGTTPTIKCILPALINIDSVKEICLTLRCRKTLYTPYYTDYNYFLSTNQLKLEDNVVSLAFSQEMTLALFPTKHKLDIRILLKNDCALALKEKQTVEVKDVLNDGMLVEGGTTKIQTLVLSNDVSEEFDGYFNDETQEFEAQFGVLYNAGGTSNYNSLENKPMINGVTLQGDLTLEDLGILDIPSELIEEMWEKGQ